MQNQQVLLKRRPTGIPQAGRFEVAIAPAPGGIAGLRAGEDVGRRLVQVGPA